MMIIIFMHIRLTQVNDLFSMKPHLPVPAPFKPALMHATGRTKSLPSNIDITSSTNQAGYEQTLFITVHRGQVRLT